MWYFMVLESLILQEMRFGETGKVTTECTEYTENRAGELTQGPILRSVSYEGQDRQWAASHQRGCCGVMF
jgi:hypothetical protein